MIDRLADKHNKTDILADKLTKKDRLAVKHNRNKQTDRETLHKQTYTPTDIQTKTDRYTFRQTNK